jgi:Na+/melibiose symporter-like transporter
MTESIARSILGMTTLMPAVLLAIAMFVFAGYRLNRKEFNALKDALELKNQGRAYSTELFEKILF